MQRKRNNCLLACLLALPLQAQQNYVRTFTPLVEVAPDTKLSADNSRVSTHYYDRAGRKVQTVLHRASPTGKDMADGRRIQTVSKTFTTSMSDPTDYIHNAGDPHTVTTEISDRGMSLCNGRQIRIDFEGGYTLLPLTGKNALHFYYYVTDYLGSIRAVCNGKTGEVLQSMEYSPSGLIFRRTNYGLQSKRFCGKEELTMHGYNMYDSGARFQYSLIPRFNTMDPLCEKFYDVSPYAYCHNNPINRIDPDGKDDFQLKINGEIVLLKRTKDEQDIIYASNMNDMINYNNSICVPKSFISSKYSTSLFARYEELNKSVIRECIADIYRVDNEQLAKSAFEFFVNNSIVEWSNVLFSKKGENSFSFITTSHMENFEVGQTYLFEKYKQNKDYTMKQAIHSHWAESIGHSKSDIELAKKQKHVYPNILLMIYNRKSYQEYDQFDIPNCLNEISVTPKK